MIFFRAKETGLSKRLLYWFGKPWVQLTTINVLILIFQIGYLLLRYEYINTHVPFYYTRNWGDSQLAPKQYLFYLPLITVVLSGVMLFLHRAAKRFYWQLLDKVFLLVPIFINIALTLSLVRIIFSVSSPFDPIINPLYMSLIPPFLTSLALTIIFTPRIIEKLKSKNIVTNPKVHAHPSMILKKPSARGGGMVFAIFLIVTSLIFVGVTPYSKPVYVGVALTALLGLLDDMQNTNPKSKLKFLENPIIRLGALFLIVLVPIYMGIRINFINNPFNGIIDILQYQITIGGVSIPWISLGITAFWMVWLMNILSWSNGVDGQYGGIVGIACIVIAILSFRFEPLQEIHMETAKIVAAAAGASFGITYFNWYPSKIMWGFGAMAAGILISMTSITIGAKVATSTLIVLIPFVDAIFIFSRRLLQRKNPLRGDRGHLHHILMDKGWGVRRIATFYWLTSAFFGIMGVLTAGQDLVLFSMTIIGLVAFIILAIHVSANRNIVERLKSTFKVLNK